MHIPTGPQMYICSVRSRRSAMLPREPSRARRLSRHPSRGSISTSSTRPPPASAAAARQGSSTTRRCTAPHKPESPGEARAGAPPESTAVQRPCRRRSATTGLTHRAIVYPLPSGPLRSTEAPTSSPDSQPVPLPVMRKRSAILPSQAAWMLSGRLSVRSPHRTITN